MDKLITKLLLLLQEHDKIISIIIKHVATSLCVSLFMGLFLSQTYIPGICTPEECCSFRDPNRCPAINSTPCCYRRCPTSTPQLCAIRETPGPMATPSPEPGSASLISPTLFLTSLSLIVLLVAVM